VAGGRWSVRSKAEPAVSAVRSERFGQELKAKS
jgi:hypothetical protein